MTPTPDTMQATIAIALGLILLAYYAVSRYPRLRAWWLRRRAERKVYRMLKRLAKRADDAELRREAGKWAETYKSTL